MAKRERVQVRMPEELKRRLAWAAERAGRTLNVEIVLRLIESFGAEIDLPIPEQAGRSRSIEARVSDLEEVVERLSALLEGKGGSSALSSTN
jgi:hypothetical protein